MTVCFVYSIVLPGEPVTEPVSGDYIFNSDQEYTEDDEARC